MIFNSFHHLLSCINKAPQKPTFLMLQAGRMPSQLTREEEQEEEEQQREREQLERRRQAAQLGQMQSRIESRTDLKAATKQALRECLVSDNTVRQSLAQQLLDGEIEERKFEQELGLIEQQEASWTVIKDLQRRTRQKILNLKYKAESYVELLPHKKGDFEKLLKDIRALNKLDDLNDKSLKTLLIQLATDQQPRAGQPAPPPKILNDDQAKAIYDADPIESAMFEQTMKRYKEIIEKPRGKSTFSRILALKKEEGRIERQVQQITAQFDSIVTRNLSKVRKQAEKERMLEMASKAVGITLKEGTEIEYSASDFLSSTERSGRATIERIIWDDEVPIRDRSGKVIDRRPGIPTIKLNTAEGKMTLGRFKKWADATDAVEVIRNLRDVEIATGLANFGIKIEEGMELSYVRRTRDSHDNLITTPTYVRITKIEPNKITLSEPVLFQPGFENVDQSEMRDWLTLGEFVKWFRRYEVEKSLGLQELRKLLATHNEQYNKRFGIEEKNNPPIYVMKDEVLRYPDESGLEFRITGIDPDGAVLDNGKKYTFSEFFYWVKNNYVEKVPEREKKPEEVHAEHEREHELHQKQHEQEHEKQHEFEHGIERYKDIMKFQEERASGTLLGRMKEMFWTTQFLSLKDLWNMTKEITEFVKRKHERRSKGRYGEVGSRLPWVIGTEFERVKQAAENEEVNKYKEAMEHWDVEKVKRTLYETGSKDEAKACIMTLLHHGEMRWDDHHFWKAINRLTSRYTMRGAELYIPDPHLIPPGQNGEDMTEPAINALWGAGQAAQWFQENISKYNSNKNNYEYKFKNLEADPKGTGGPAGECKRLLKVWQEGGYVNPQDYEAMIDGAIKFGKMDGEDKMFYIICGLVARQGNKDGKNPGGETLLSLDRAGELDSKYLNQFPLLDYFTQERVFDPAIWDAKEKKWGKKRKLQLKDYEKFVYGNFADEMRGCEPGPQFNRFMWEVMLMNEMVRTRISKGIRNAENMDHDDAHLYIPPTTPTEIDGLTTGPTGQKKYFTNSGYANAFPGFGQYLVSLSYAYEEEINEEAKKNKMIAIRDCINSYIRYDAILDNRLFKKDGDHRARLDDRHLERGPIVDLGVKLKLHRTQLRNLILEIGKVYGQDWHLWLYGAKTGSWFDPNEQKKQMEYERKIDGLKDLIPQLIASDNGQKALEVLNRMRDSDPNSEMALRGIQRVKRPSKAAIEEARARGKEIFERIKAAGHGHH